jgi:hypothetical protein
MFTFSLQHQSILASQLWNPISFASFRLESTSSQASVFSAKIAWKCDVFAILGFLFRSAFHNAVCRCSIAIFSQWHP